MDYNYEPWPGRIPENGKEEIETSIKLQNGINGIEGLRVISNPDLTIFSFTSDSIDIFEVGDFLSKQNWFLDRMY